MGYSDTKNTTVQMIGGHHDCKFQDGVHSHTI